MVLYMMFSVLSDLARGSSYFVDKCFAAESCTWPPAGLHELALCMNSLN